MARPAVAGSGTGVAQIHGMDGRGGAGRAQTEDAEQDRRSTDGKCKENITHGGCVGEPRRRAPHCRRPTHLLSLPLDGAVSRVAAVAIQARFWLVLRVVARQPVAYSRSTASSMLRPISASAVHSQGQRVQLRRVANPDESGSNVGSRTSGPSRRSSSCGASTSTTPGEVHKRLFSHPLQARLQFLVSC